MTMPNPQARTLIDTRTLALRWGVDQRTVLRYCRFSGVPRVRFSDYGKVFYRVHDIAALEQRIFAPTK